MEEKENSPGKRKGLGHDILLFLFGPLVFLLLVRFTGYQIFYSSDATDRERKRVIFLLSFGALFYLVIIVVLTFLAN
ncbi:MAG: hypothetical protein JNK18_15110 [Cyclobacteriaceae bacterium]|nr:hypothetical protein [Cyclobacteriaceae bacterium]